MTCRPEEKIKTLQLQLNNWGGKHERSDDVNNGVSDLNLFGNYKTVSRSL